MNITEVFTELDSLFESKQYDKVEAFILGKIEQARAEGDRQSMISLMNEGIGFFRDKSEYNKSLKMCDEVIELMKQEGLEGTKGYATTLLNIANANRAAGQLEASLSYYSKVIDIYDRLLSKTDFEYASLFNNISLLFQEMGEDEKAIAALEKALKIAQLNKEARIEVATTHTNLAASLIRVKRYDEARTHLQEALTIFEQDEEKNFHYSAALAAMGQLEYLTGNKEQAIKLTKEAMEDVEKRVGKTQGYLRMEENLRMMLDEDSTETKDNILSIEKESRQTIQNGMELSKAYFEKYKDRILHAIPQLKGRMAIGLVGEGSECFGFDDIYSRDHDFGPAFCIWLTKEDYKKYGQQLDEIYQQLPKQLNESGDLQSTELENIQRIATQQAHNRIGVMQIEAFYQQILGVKHFPLSTEEWLEVKEESLLTATNGEVFVDELGEFSKIREYLKEYYPEEVRIRRLAQELALLSQMGQYNYKRMLKRGEYLTAEILLSDFIKHTLHVLFLLNREYAPYDKWLHKASKNLSVLPEIGDILIAIKDFSHDPQNLKLQNGENQITLTIEIIAKLIVDELKKQKLTVSDELFLSDQAWHIYNSLVKKEEEEHKKLVEEIVNLEWKAFDLVKNEGGRASCQDNYETFYIMRKSQYLTWDTQMLRQFRDDFIMANQKGRNLITEKYARMMESTSHEQYEQIKHLLPLTSEEQKPRIEQIISIQVKWMEEFAREYPNIAGNARKIHSFEDTLYDTSYETYLRGELLTYSEKMLVLYEKFIICHVIKQQNLTREIMIYTIKNYGYDTLQNAEQNIQK